MKNFKFKLGLSIFVLGLTGVFSLLTIPIPTESLPPEILARFSERTLRWLSLLNPLILLVIAVVLGTLLYDKVKLGVPSIERALKGERFGHILLTQLKYGFIGGLVAGVLIILMEQAFLSLIAEEMEAIENQIQVTPLLRFLYGGITEEILLRFGFMTVLAWGLFKIFKRLNGFVYWIAILLSSILFGVGHLPVAFQATGSPSSWLILYIIAGNSVGGIIFGWLYWKKGLEAAIVAHMMVHVVFLTAQVIVS